MREAVRIQYGHWGITVSRRHNESDYAPFACEVFAYPALSGYGPCETADVKAAAIARFDQLRGGGQ